MIFFLIKKQILGTISISKSYNITCNFQSDNNDLNNICKYYDNIKFLIMNVGMKDKL